MKQNKLIPPPRSFIQKYGNPFLDVPYCLNTRESGDFFEHSLLRLARARDPYQDQKHGLVLYLHQETHCFHLYEEKTDLFSTSLSKGEVQRFLRIHKNYIKETSCLLEDWGIVKTPPRKRLSFQVLASIFLAGLSLAFYSYFLHNGPKTLAFLALMQGFLITSFVFVEK